MTFMTFVTFMTFLYSAQHPLIHIIIVIISRLSLQGNQEQLSPQQLQEQPQAAAPPPVSPESETSERRKDYFFFAISWGIIMRIDGKNVIL